MTMFNNWLAAFDKRTPSPLYGKPLIYLLGATGARAIPGSVVVPPYSSNAILGPDVAGTDKIACINFGGGDQMRYVAELSYAFAMLDNPDAYGIGNVQRHVTLAFDYGLGIIAKNPKLVNNGALPFIAHPNVFGVIVERGAGTPADYDALRKQARKDGLLPVWFVFDGHDGDSQQCAAQIQHGGYQGMGVTYSTGRAEKAYNDSHTVLLPVA